MQLSQRDRGYLLDIFNSAKLAIAYIQERSKENFVCDLQLQDSVIRRLEVIGEAARRISVEAKSYLPELPFDDMSRMRNILIHEYGDIDLDVVWDTITIDLPALIDVLEELFPHEL